MQNGPQSDQQLLMMEEAQPANTYINMRGEAIDMIERTINELGGVFGQLAAMVQEQGFVRSVSTLRSQVDSRYSEQIQRIDANTEDVVDNVQGAQRELMKYWSRVSGNRWLVAKMFGVLMARLILLHSWAKSLLISLPDLLPAVGSHCRITGVTLVQYCIWVCGGAGRYLILVQCVEKLYHYCRLALKEVCIEGRSLAPFR